MMVASTIVPRDTGKFPHRLQIVQRLFHGGIGRVVPVLREIDAQHPLQALGPAAHTLRIGVVRRRCFRQDTFELSIAPCKAARSH